MATPKIDIHPHLISDDLERYPVSPLGGKRSKWSKDRHCLSATQLVEAMDSAGVAKAAIVHSSTTYGYDNSLVCDAVAEHPDRFTAVCSIDALADDAVNVLTDLVARGCSGIRFFTTGSTLPTQATWLNDPASYDVWQYCGEIGIPICVQCKPEGLNMLRDMMDRFPETQVILDHLGKPDFSTGAPYPDAHQMLEMASHYREMCVKFSPSALKATREGKSSPDEILPQVLKAYGARRIAWGSNYPASPGDMPGIVKECEEAFHFASSAELEEIMGGTALRLYPSLNA